MNNYGNASEGLQKMFIAQVCLYHMQRAVCHSDHQSAGNYCSIVLSIIYLVGLYNAGKDINGCANAFVLSIISLVCNIISSLTSFNVLFVDAVFCCSSCSYIYGNLSGVYVCK